MNKKLLLALLTFILIFPLLAVLILTFAQGKTQNIATAKVYLVALADNGKYGKKVACNDSLVSYERKILFENEKDLTALTIKELFNAREVSKGAFVLYNFFPDSQLILDDVTVYEDGTTLVHFSGNLKLNGVCDVQRLEAQVKETLSQFANINVNDITIYINGKETGLIANSLKRTQNLSTKYSTQTLSN
ncbi:MAG: hypothetical protein HYW86_04730 [Candidatus Roizmanbacteria bacterium]|nr:MAG: hypothetical protein HYW86_04730 [Candidatus Roizmanbacteria bacterium]